VSSAKRLHYDYADYLRSLEMSEPTLEYCDGVIYAMADGTPAHAQLSAAMIAALRELRSGESVSIASPPISVAVDDVHDGITLDGA
jgi:hypothetical protein